MNFKEIEGKPDRWTLEEIREFYASIFERVDFDKFEKRIDEAEKLLINLALSEEKIVGFKIGYRIAPKTFYSWVGGVDAQFRGRGIAAELMRRQHEWCAANGFEIIRTKTMNRFKSMLILNLKNGFDITEVYRDSRAQIKIILEKDLRG